MNTQHTLGGIIIPAETIKNGVSSVAAAISRDHPNGVTLVCVIKGALVFCADLMRLLTVPVRLECVSAKSYGLGTTSGDVLTSLPFNPEGLRLLLVEDIVDTGKTLFVLRNLLLSGGAKSAEVACLFDKPSRRERDITARYVGLTVPDKFIVGYGLDYAEQFRNLPDIHELL